MTQILHILTKPRDSVAEQLISLQTQERDQQVTVFDLNVPEPDYSALLREIFDADSITVW